MFFLTPHCTNQSYNKCTNANNLGTRRRIPHAHVPRDREVSYVSKGLCLDHKQFLIRGCGVPVAQRVPPRLHELVSGEDELRERVLDVQASQRKFLRSTATPAGT